MSESIKLQYKTITQLVVENLREQILTGKIKPGERLNQDIIAKEHSVSKMPIREALHILKNEGYVTIQANKGATASLIDLKEVDELFALKVLIEADMLTASLPLISDEKLAEAQQIIAKINLASSARQWSDLNVAYYKCLYSGIERPQTEEMLSLIKTKVERFNYACFVGINKTKQYTGICKLLEHCIERKPEQAVNQLKQLLWETKDEIKALL